jgi:hypothetical protein
MGGQGGHDSPISTRAVRPVGHDPSMNVLYWWFSAVPATHIDLGEIGGKGMAR